MVIHAHGVDSNKPFQILIHTNGPGMKDIGVVALLRSRVGCSNPRYLLQNRIQLALFYMAYRCQLL